jgi:response regulator NasT
MEKVLIVSQSEKSVAFFTDLLNSANIHQVTVINSCSQARRILLEQHFDLVLVNAPLKDESGENFSRYVASQNIAQVILVVKVEHFDAVSTVCEEDGVLVVAKPLNKSVFWSALSLVKSAQKRVARVNAENAKLKQKIEDIRIVDRAKWILVSHMQMSEQDAHRYIEKQAMDMRSTKRAIAEGILRTYEN